MQSYYQYDSITKEYEGTGQRPIDTRATKRLGVETYAGLAPNQTLVEPPAPGPKKAVVWNGHGWGQVDDRRGEIWWDVNGEDVKVVDIGDPAEVGLYEDAPPPKPATVAEIYEEARRRKRALVGAPDDVTFSEIKQAGIENAIEIVRTERVRELTVEETERAGYLEGVKNALDLIDLFAYSLTLDPPSNIEDDTLWP